MNASGYDDGLLMADRMKSTVQHASFDARYAREVQSKTSTTLRLKRMC
jgi:hypothetical protein